MLAAVIGGVIIAALIAGSVFLAFRASLSVPPGDLRRRWRAETRARRF